MIPYVMGQCIHCGNQAMVRNPDGKIVSGKSGTRTYWLVLKGTDGANGNFLGKESKIGTFPVCSVCAELPLNPNDVLQSLISSPHQFLDSKCNEVFYLTDRSIALDAVY